MKQIHDYGEVSPLVLRYFKRDVITNNFLHREDYQAEISEGRLFYEAGEDFLNLYLRRDGFYQLYFYALSREVMFPGTKSPLMTEIAGNPPEILKSNGFRKILERVQLEIDLKKDPVPAGEKATKKDANEIFSLLEQAFDPLTGCLPTLTQIQTECDEGNFYLCRKEGKTGGILRRGKSGKTAQIKHLCVLEEFRGMGIGKELVRSFLQENPKATVWTGAENTAALRLYQSLGFSMSRLKSTVYRKDVSYDYQRKNN